MIIALTASVFSETKAVVLSAGCDEFVRKPFQAQILFDVMAKHLGLSYVYQYIEPYKPLSNVPSSPLNFSYLLAEISQQYRFVR